MSAPLWMPTTWRRLKAEAAELLAEGRATPETKLSGEGYEALLEPAPFDSALLGRRMAKSPYAKGDAARIAEAVLFAARERGYDHLSARVPTTEMPAIQALTAAGFYPVDTHAELEAFAPFRPADSQATPVDTASSGDLAALGRLSGDLFRLSRFAADPALAPERVRALMAKWIENDATGRADRVFTARDGARVLGYIACLFEPASELEPATASIDLIGVSPEAQGRGIGQSLVAAAMRYYEGKAERFLVETQGGNTGALRLYLRNGFRPAYLDMTLHWQEKGTHE